MSWGQVQPIFHQVIAHRSRNDRQSEMVVQDFFPEIAEPILNRPKVLQLPVVQEKLRCIVRTAIQ